MPNVFDLDLELFICWAQIFNFDTATVRCPNWTLQYDFPRTVYAVSKYFLRCKNATKMGSSFIFVLLKSPSNVELEWGLWTQYSEKYDMKFAV